eukprot:c8077_g1_i1.p1 GENE.c8077_g1_i1~~c8077_g1_i1.p1  ORF type:complete len:1060 (-),score=298.28 c8077_g1_i1:48-3197(-)
MSEQGVPRWAYCLHSFLRHQSSNLIELLENRETVDMEEMQSLTAEQSAHIMAELNKREKAAKFTRVEEMVEYLDATIEQVKATYPCQVSREACEAQITSFRTLSFELTESCELTIVMGNILNWPCDAIALSGCVVQYHAAGNVLTKLTRISSRTTNEQIYQHLSHHINTFDIQSPLHSFKAIHFTERSALMQSIVENTFSDSIKSILRELVQSNHKSIAIDLTEPIITADTNTPANLSALSHEIISVCLNNSDYLNRIALVVDSSSDFEELCDVAYRVCAGRVKMQYHENLHKGFPELDPTATEFPALQNILTTTQSIQCTRQDIPVTQARCFRLLNALTPSECSGIIETVSRVGFEDMSWEYDRSYRSGTRKVMHSRILAEELWKRLSTHFVLSDLDQVRPFGFGNEGTWAPDGLNPVFRFVKYQEGDLFSKHRDGSFVETDNRRSIYTVVGYLNGPPDFNGGELNVYSGSREKSVVAAHKIVPECGSIVVFTHDLLHEGLPVLHKPGSPSTKYIFRTDIMFRRVSGFRSVNLSDPLFIKSMRLYDESILLQQQGNVRESTTRYLEAMEIQCQLPSVPEVPVFSSLNVPIDIWILIFSFLERPQDILKCAHVCRVWRSGALSNVLWKQQFRQRWPHIATATIEHSINKRPNPQNETIYNANPNQITVIDPTLIWWRTFQNRIIAELNFQVLVVSINPSTVAYTMLGHLRQLKPLNRGDWGGDHRLKSSKFHGIFPNVVARSRGHYWSAASAFRSYFVGAEVLGKVWFGKETDQRAMDGQGRFDVFVLELLLTWVLLFGGMQPEEAECHPLCLVLPVWFCLSPSTCATIASALFSNLGFPAIRILDSPTAIANGHGILNGIVVEVGREYSWITPIIDGKGVLVHSRKCLVAGLRNENEKVQPETIKAVTALIVEIATAAVTGTTLSSLSILFHLCVFGESPLAQDDSFWENVRTHLLAHSGETIIHKHNHYAALWGAEALVSIDSSRSAFSSTATDVTRGMVEKSTDTNLIVSDRKHVQTIDDYWGEGVRSSELIPLFKPLTKSDLVVD